MAIKEDENSSSSSSKEKKKKESSRFKFQNKKDGPRLQYLLSYHSNVLPLFVHRKMPTFAAFISRKDTKPRNDPLLLYT